MPKIFQLESYDGCFADNVKYSNAAYCVADVYVKPNASSRLWSIIQENSSRWKTQFRHDHLVYGICMEQCKKFLTRFDKMTQREYFVKAPKNFSTSISDPFTFYHSIEDRIEYSEAFSECINYPLRKQFQLEAFAEIQYCEVSGKAEEIGNCNLQSKEIKKQDFPSDQLDKVFLIIFALFALLVVSATFCDASSQQTTFQATILGACESQHPINMRLLLLKFHPGAHKLVRIFSIQSNYQRFIRDYKIQEPSELRFVDSIKFLSMLLVIIGHCILFHSVLPFANPEFVESVSAT